MNGGSVYEEKFRIRPCPCFGWKTALLIVKAQIVEIDGLPFYNSRVGQKAVSSLAAVYHPTCSYDA